MASFPKGREVHGGATELARAHDARAVAAHGRRTRRAQDRGKGRLGAPGGAGVGTPSERGVWPLAEERRCARGFIGVGAALAAALAGLRARPGLERAALRARFLTRALRTSPSGLAIVPARVGTPLH